MDYLNPITLQQCVNDFKALINNGEYEATVIIVVIFMHFFILGILRIKKNFYETENEKFDSKLKKIELQKKKNPKKEAYKKKKSKKKKKKRR